VYVVALPVAAVEVAGSAVLIDVKHERVAGWYEAYGALPLLVAPRPLLLPLATLQAALKAAGRL